MCPNIRILVLCIGLKMRLVGLLLTQFFFHFLFRLYEGKIHAVQTIVFHNTFFQLNI